MPDAPLLGARRDARRSSSTTAPSARASPGRSCTRACAPSRPPAGAARRPPRRAAWSPAAAPSRGARRAPAVPAPAPAARRSGPAEAPCSGPQPRSYTFKVNRKEQRAALRSALSLHAERGSIGDPRRGRASRPPRRARRFDLLDDWDQPPARRSSCSPTRSRAAALSFRNLDRVAVLTPENVGVTDLLGAASLLVSEAALCSADGAHGRAAQIRARTGGGLMEHTQVIIRPVVSEKSYVLSAADRYTFRVHPDAHKTQIRQAVEALFDVHVVDVRTLSVKSKPKRRGVTQRSHARRGRRRSSRCARASASRSSRAWRPSRAGARCRFASPSRRAPEGGSSPTRTSPRSRSPSPRRRSSKDSRRAAGATPTGARPRVTAAAAPSAPTGAIDFKRRKDGVPREGRGDRVRPQPLRLHRAAALRRRREALHPRAPAADGRA